MDVAHPVRTAIPTLDGRVLEVLAGTTAPLSTSEIHRLCGDGSYAGVRLVLLRLAEQGVAIADARRSATYFVANREHLAWPAIEILTGLRAALLDGLRVRIAAWTVPPIHASLFGSAARADGDAASDIDILFVRSGDIAAADEAIWETQIAELREWVHAATGNRCGPFSITLGRLDEHLAARDPLVEAWRRDGIALAGDDIGTLIRARTRADG
jgi:predicted nucleotidyltransferase